MSTAHHWYDNNEPKHTESSRQRLRMAGLGKLLWIACRAGKMQELCCESDTSVPLLNWVSEKNVAFSMLSIKL